MNKPLYTRVVLLSLAAMLIVTTAGVSGYSFRSDESRTPIDFQVFHVAAQLIWRGDIARAYHLDAMVRFMGEFTGNEALSPWSYPPPYGLIVAPFAFLPLGAAYFVFTLATLSVYLITLRRLSGPHFATVLLAIFPALMLMVATGQNGFLTGTLIGLACIGFLRGKAAAGLPLGLMVIKPHLAAGFALYALIAGRWRTATIAALTVAVASALTTTFLGYAVWAGFFHGMHEARALLETGSYPLFRLVSVYAALRWSGASAIVALSGQAVVALLAMAALSLSVRRRLPMTQQLGLAVFGCLLITPYAYDYDLPILGIGLALLLPDLLRLGGRREQVAVFGLCFFTSGWGLAKTGTIDALGISREEVASVAGVTLLGLFILVCRILARGLGHANRTKAQAEKMNCIGQSKVMANESGAGLGLA